MRKGGGILLAREPQDISVGSVVRGAEGEALPAECFALDGGRCVVSRCCRLKGVLEEAVDAFYAVLDGYTLADIARNRQTLARVLLHPAAHPRSARAAR